MSDPLLGVFQFPVLYIDDHKHIPCYITAIIDAHLASILWSSPPWTLPLSLLLVCMHSMNSSKAILQPVRHLEVITASNTEEGASCSLKPSSNNQMLMEVIHPTSVSFDRERTLSSSSRTKQNPHITFKSLWNTSNFLSFKHREYTSSATLTKEKNCTYNRRSQSSRIPPSPRKHVHTKKTLKDTPQSLCFDEKAAEIHYNYYKSPQKRQTPPSILHLQALKVQDWSS